MRRGSLWWLQAALLGALTGLAVIALSYLAEQALGLAFVPFVLFDWLARVLPGGVITLGIDAMVRVIVASGIGPIDVVAKAIEQSFGMALWLAVSLGIGVALAAWLRRQSVVVSGTTIVNGGAGRQAGAFAGLAFALVVVAAMIGMRSFGANQPWTLLWLAVLLPGWGAFLGSLLERLLPYSIHGGIHILGAPRTYGQSSRHRGQQDAGAPREQDSHPGVSLAKGAMDALAAGPPPPSIEPVAAEAAGTPGLASGAITPTPAGNLSMINRRAFLQRAAGGSVLVAILAAGLGRLLALNKARTGAGQPLGEVNVQAAPGTPAASGAPGAGAPAAAAIPPTPSGRSAPAPGTRPEITPTANFYRIDIDLVPPKVAGASWQLQISGLFDRPRNLTLPDLLAMEAVTQPITQSCISNPIGGDLISSAYYTGVRLRDVLAELGVQTAARQLALHAADGFYESVAMQDMQDPRVLLVYGMNGTTLPVEHGYPLRIYIPNRYGMKQPKWITSLEAVNHDLSGYWVDRGWSPEARPQVISIIDAIAKDQQTGGRVPIGGIAWAGDRGIRSVEVQVDNGAWSEAVLIAPPIGPLTWIQWRFDWTATPGRHTFRVRATDGKGALQIGQDQDTYPNGATGYHTVTATF